MAVAVQPTRPVLRYHGGKWRLATWIIAHLPSHRVYVEPFGGAGSVLLRKPRSFAEVYNDRDGDVVNVFRVLRDRDRAAELERLLRLTPWSRREFLDSYEPTPDPVERARRTDLRGFMAFGTTSRRPGLTGFRARAYRQSHTGQQDWVHYPEQIAAYVERLAGVCIEERPALEIIAQQDGPDTLYYCDPPYPVGTRSSIRCASELERAYAHDMTDDDHRELARALRACQGMVVLSGYPCALYDLELYPDWRRVARPALADGARARTEVLWISPAAATALERDRSYEASRQGALATFEAV
jgi:DNA adenine methylase